MNEIKAWEIIDKYPEVRHDKKGCFILPDGYEETPELKEALDYLWIEWDYAVTTESKYKEQK